MNTDFDGINNIIQWAKEVNFAITVSDINDNIIYMNDKSNATFPDIKVGDNLKNCHSNKSNEVINKIKENNIDNIYTIQKGGVKKLIYQTPWYINGIVSGIIELSIVLLDNMPHYNRD
jgi:hypothetical protein